MLAPVVGLLLNLLASGTPCAGDNGHAGGHCHDSCDSCDSDISFLQAELRFATRATETRAPPAPLLKPIGRSFFSEDPANSAKWWLRYSSSEQLPPEKMMTVGLDQSSESAAVMVKSKGEEVEKLYFLNVNDWKSPSNLTMKDFVQAAKLSWGSVMKREQLYSPWTDFHDGHTSDTIRLDHFEEDNHLFQLYPDHGVARAYVPNTTWTIEWRKGAATEYMNPSTKAYGKKVSFPRPDKCRNFSNDENPERTYWKSIFPVLNASAAKEFALDVLHAKPLEKENPFPWPRQPGCIAVQWASLPQAAGEPFQLHFVEDFVYDTVLHSIPEFLQYQQDFLQTDVSKGCINSFMLNNLILETESLDPFARRLDELSVPYFVFAIEDRYALLFSFPGNQGVTLQLQSPHLSYVAPRPVEFCK